MAFDIKKFIPRFIEESEEMTRSLESGLLGMKQGDSSPDTIHELFRCAHKIKGASRMLNLLPISNLSHKMEDVFSVIREDKIKTTPSLISLLLKSVDLLDNFLEELRTEKELSPLPQELMDHLIMATKGALPENHTNTVDQPPVKHQNDDTEEIPATTTKPEVKTKSSGRGIFSDTIRIQSSLLDGLIVDVGEMINHHNRLRYNIRQIDEIVKRNEKALKKSDEEDKTQSIAPLLSDLNFVLKKALNEISYLDVISHELQERTLHLRMLPLNIVLETLPRTVSEIADEQNKKVRFTLSGQNTQIDKKIIEKIGDPILHIIRNAVDHGIESPEDRKSAGKDETATISIEAGYSGGNVQIIIQDDGRGIDTEKVVKKAIQRGLVGESESETLNKAQIHEFLFMPGFSTASIITDISGRGVGLDIVKNAIEEVKGSILLQSDKGKGTTFTLKVPLTLATITALYVRTSEHIYALPINYLSEIVQVKDSQIIEAANRKVIRLRDQLIPVYQLQDILFKRKGSTRELVYNLVIIRFNNDLLSIVVDEIIDQNESIIKALPLHLQGNSIVSGIIVNEKNQLINVLHVPQLVAMCRKEEFSSDKKQGGQTTTTKKKILVVDDSINTREIEKSILESFGYEVHLAVDGDDGLNAAKATEFDLVVTDVDMPKMDGFSLTSALRKEPGYKNIPIIILTSREKEEDKRKGIDVGADAYIVKGGFDQSNLKETIETLLV